MRLLLVEDDPILGNGVEAGLKQAGFTVDWTQDGKSAQLALETTQYELVVLDLGLPRLPGMDLLRWLRARGSDLPVLVLTARDSIPDRIHRAYRQEIILNRTRQKHPRILILMFLCHIGIPLLQFRRTDGTQLRQIALRPFHPLQKEINIFPCCFMCHDTVRQPALHNCLCEQTFCCRRSHQVDDRCGSC